MLSTPQSVTLSFDVAVASVIARWWQGRHKIAQHLGALRSMLLEFQRELRNARPQMTGGRRQNPADSALLARVVKHVEKMQQHVEAPCVALGLDLKESSNVKIKILGQGEGRSQFNDSENLMMKLRRRGEWK